jgi:hypothetical protein
MPQHRVSIQCVDDLVRLARLRKVTLFTVWVRVLNGDEGYDDAREGDSKGLLHLPFKDPDDEPNDQTPQGSPTMADMPELAWTHLTLARFDGLKPLLPLMGNLERAYASADVMLMPCWASKVADFWEVFGALDGKFATPKTLEWYRDPLDTASDFHFLSAVLSKAADRPERLTLANLRVDRHVLDALRSHAPQLRHLTLLGCECDPEEVHRECKLDSLWTGAPGAPVARAGRRLLWRVELVGATGVREASLLLFEQSEKRKALRGLT